MKKSNGYLIKQLEDEWILLPVGEKTETVSVSGDYEVLYGSTDENIAPLATRILKRKK